MQNPGRERQSYQAGVEGGARAEVGAIERSVPLAELGKAVSDHRAVEFPKELCGCSDGHGRGFVFRRVEGE